MSHALGNYLRLGRNTVSAAEEETQKTAGKGDVIKENDSEAVNKVESGKGIKEKEEQYPVTKDCQKETPTEAKVKMLVDYLSQDGKPFKINLTLPRDCIMQKVLIKVMLAYINSLPILISKDCGELQHRA